MASQTRRGLEDFDNQHDFERMAADVLNALGYAEVEPIAPAGGPDGGRDIVFREGDTPGIALVTLEKNVRDKFKRDLVKQSDAEGVIALFCNVDVSPSMKLTFAREAVAEGYRLEVFDLERLRSLLDSSLKDVRRRYLRIDDELEARLRSAVRRLLRFPDATPSLPVPPTLIEALLTDKLPWRLFDLLVGYEENDIMEVPQIGLALHDHLKEYYQFRQDALRTEGDLLLRIGQMVGVRLPQAWRIFLRYAMLRFAGASQETITGWGDFLNYGITWDDAERVFLQLSNEAAVRSAVSELFALHRSLSQGVATLKTDE
jgi:hypothetical protein